MKAEYRTKFMICFGGYFEGINKKPVVHRCGHSLSLVGIFVFKGIYSAWKEAKYLS